MCNKILIARILMFLVPLAILCQSLPLTDESVALQLHSQMNCSSCEQQVEILRGIWKQNLTQTERAMQVAQMCNSLQIAEPVLCDTVLTIMKDEILYIIDQLIKEPKHLCGYFIKGCGVASTFLNTTWTVNIPENKPEPVQPENPLTGSPTLRVLHLADIHFDPAYLAGSEVQCSIPLCCRDNRPFNVTPNYPIKQPAGYWGSFGMCDIPLHTVENLFVQLKNNFKFDAIYWTGDLIPHNVWNQSRTWNLEIYQNLTQLFVKYFPDKRIYSAVGNHESVPGNSFAPSSLNLPSNLNTNWLYDGLARNWLPWLPNDTERAIKLRGSYVTSPYPGFRIISVNSNYCYTANYWLFLYNTDPDGTLQWLCDQLHQAEIAGDKALLDVESYWMNMTEANLPGQQPQWKLLYRTKDSYHMNSLLPKDWSDLINRFKNDDALLDAYINHQKRHPNSACVNSASCRFEMLCDMRKATTEPNDHLCDDLHQNNAGITGKPAPVKRSFLLFATFLVCYYWLLL